MFDAFTILGTYHTHFLIQNYKFYNLIKRINLDCLKKIHDNVSSM